MTTPSATPSRTPWPDRRPVMSGVAPESPFSWDELVSIVKNGQLEVLGRRGDDQTAYERWLEATKLEWRSIGDLAKVRYLGYPEGRDVLTGLRCAGCIPRSDSAVVRLFPNDWPYWVDCEISHGVVWSSRELSAEDVEAFLAKELSGCDFLWFRNPTLRQSIPEVWHWQVFHRGHVPLAPSVTPSNQ